MDINANIIQLLAEQQEAITCLRRDNALMHERLIELDAESTEAKEQDEVAKVAARAVQEAARRGPRNG